MPTATAMRDSKIYGLCAHDFCISQYINRKYNITNPAYKAYRWSIVMVIGNAAGR